MDGPFEQVLDAPEPEPTPEPVITEEPLDDETYALIYRGHLTDNFNIGVHNISIRTLRIGEELEATLLAAKYRDTIDYPRAIATAFVAAAITEVDGAPLLAERIGPADEKLDAKFRYVLNQYYWPTISQINDRYQLLYQKMIDRYGSAKKD